MPPKPKITRDMIVEASFNIIREEGIEGLNVRRVAAELNCSTQPIMYHFSTVNELKTAVYARVNAFHVKYIMMPEEGISLPFLAIGLRYIRFAEDEKNLFCFLFQTGRYKDLRYCDVLNSDIISKVLVLLSDNAGISKEMAKDVFSVLFVCVHGAASFIANNSMKYDREHFEKMLKTAFSGAISVISNNACMD